MRTFIVRICREGAVPGPGPIGIVEEAGSEKQCRFNGFEELCRIMSGSDTRKKSAAKGSRNK